METTTVLQVPVDGWTMDDLPHTDFRYELVDGALLVTAPPLVVRSVLASELGPLLDRENGVLVDADVFFDPRGCASPLRRRAAGR